MFALSISYGFPRPAVRHVYEAAKCANAVSVAMTTTTSSAPKLLLRRCIRTHVKISVYVKQMLMATFKESAYPI